MDKQHYRRQQGQQTHYGSENSTSSQQDNTHPLSQASISNMVEIERPPVARTAPAGLPGSSSFLLDPTLLQQLSATGPLHQQQASILQSNPLLYLGLGSATHLSRLQQGQAATASLLQLASAGQRSSQQGAALTGINQILEELGVQRLAEQDRQNLMVQSTLMRRERNDVRPDSSAPSPPSRLWSQVAKSDTAVASKGTSTAGKASKDKGGKNAPRPSRLPCRARGMPEDHDYNVRVFFKRTATHHFLPRLRWR